ncbi:MULTISPECIES: hypothetical protein [Clostridium]|uniref:hypothetical protein n=1 Tax=Clostridium TaxID=1485 RepID=UPI0008253B16|nr:MULTISPECIES: hypothetical protein [Clostridium]PJI07055.1 hypothetical protein CUB90_03885 [Clostridium sp. CT7]
MRESKGWISIYRKIEDSWLWQERPFSKGQAWIDLLLSANYQEKKTLFDSNLIQVKRGELITSMRKLCTKWGWSNSKVKRFLELLSCDEMIIYKSDSKKTTISIVNYSTYQDMNISKSDIETSPINHRNLKKTLLKRTNNNDDNDNNDDNIYRPNSNEFRLASYLFKYIKRNNDKTRKPNIEKWAKTFHYMLEIDKRNIEEVKAVIKWCQEDPFWYKNILSPEKLRKHYDRLMLNMKDSRKKEKQDNFSNYSQRKYDYAELEKKLTEWQNEEDEILI